MQIALWIAATYLLIGAVVASWLWEPEAGGRLWIILLWPLSIAAKIGMTDDVKMFFILAVLIAVAGLGVLYSYTPKPIDVCDTPARYDAMRNGRDCSIPNL